ncbi:hypothetical protein LOTGIDRAFT_230291 [Lottia gigantea]|uniref:Transmembrane protein 220 n=1 Tax=Lottia gigantea TaxID=225164 RepID=V4B162_LOTGI|nr:hypothetical protein LOTGIDRAFT_230291 [Lottia gigantea]ESP04033.1 hypothetical protein LOTGIDRAFT_230291 [Lottia gigantea]
MNKVAVNSMSNSKPNILYNPLFEPVDSQYTARRMVVWKLINMIMSVFFLLAAVANVNDYDWYIWVPIYSIPAFFSIFLVLKPALINNSVYNISVSTVLVMYSGYFIYLIVVFLQTIQNSKAVNNPLIHEEGRETVGMFIILLWLVISRFTSLGRPEPIQGNKGLLNGLLVLTISLAVLPIMAWAVCFIGDNHKHIGHCNGMFR